MANEQNLKPGKGKQALGGVSVRLSAYLPDQATANDWEHFKASQTPYALSKRLGEMMAALLEDEGYYTVVCPACAAENLTVNIDGSEENADDWKCPACGHEVNFLEWKRPGEGAPVVKDDRHPVDRVYLKPPLL